MILSIADWIGLLFWGGVGVINAFQHWFHCSRRLLHRGRYKTTVLMEGSREDTHTHALSLTHSFLSHQHNAHKQKMGPAACWLTLVVGYSCALLYVSCFTFRRMYGTHGVAQSLCLCCPAPYLLDDALWCLKDLVSDADLAHPSTAFWKGL